MVRKLTDVLKERERNEADTRDLRSRSDSRRDRIDDETRLADMATTLIRCSDKQIGAIAPPEDVLEAVMAARAIKSPVALNRQMRLIRRRIRGADVESLNARMAQVLDDSLGGPAREYQAWAAKLIASDAALDELLGDTATDERQRLRQLIRNARKNAGAPKPRRALTAAVRALLMAREDT